MLRIRHIDEAPFHRLRYLNAGKRGKTVSSVLPLLRGKVDELPNDLDALIVASDLQGVAPSWPRGGANTLLGVVLCDALLHLAEAGTLPYPERTGVVLAGDLYSAPAGDKRGATGDVREVWRAFASIFRWVTGVQGNHDTFGKRAERAAFEADERLHLLDDEVRELDGLRFGGVGRIIGNPNKLGRRSEADFHAGLALVLESMPRVLVLHQGPNGERDQRGDESIRERIEQQPPRLVVCGHVHWKRPLTELPTGTQVLNTDSRVVVLTH